VGKNRADDVAFPLSRLVDLRLVERVVPVHQRRLASSRQALYLLADHYVAFWYRFVDRLRHLLALRRYDEALERIKEGFDQYVSRWALEDLCRQFLWQAAAADRLPRELQFDETGSWWIARDEVQDEIDVVAMQGGRAVLAGECKWSVRPVGGRELEGLTAALRKAHEDLQPIDRPWRALFSRSGFEPDLARRAEDPAERLLLVGPRDLYW
jgi:AAA+ ATPase superfamily predicted ATPase